MSMRRKKINVECLPTEDAISAYNFLGELRFRMKLRASNLSRIAYKKELSRNRYWISKNEKSKFHFSKTTQKIYLSSGDTDLCISILK